MSLGHFISGQWVASDGAMFASADPASGQVIWQGSSAEEGQVGRAVAAARSSLASWRSRPLAERIGYLEAFAGQVQAHKDELAATISSETGKPLWESLSEVQAMVAKVALSVQAWNERRQGLRSETNGMLSSLSYRPVGVMAVLGPFNLPGHIPNGHIVPALLAGNTVVFKPSELTPAVAEKTAQMWQASGLPPGVFNLVQGGPETGRLLVTSPAIDGLLFTGSYATGKALHRLLAGHPEKLVALELGGNNPLVVYHTAQTDAAVLLSILSAFITAGQRCTCARRLIVENNSAGGHFLERLATAIDHMRIGPFTDRPEPFCGPVISDQAAERLLGFQAKLIDDGAKPIVTMQAKGTRRAFLTPGLLDVTEMKAHADDEWFGPLLQVIRVDDFQAAIDEANRTAYGLSAGLLTDDTRLFDQFQQAVTAGHMVFNRQTTGASSSLPFGGLGRSGNHRPSGYFAVDYCADPVATLATERLVMPATLPAGLDFLNVQR